MVRLQLSNLKQKLQPHLHLCRNVDASLLSKHHASYGAASDRALLRGIANSLLWTYWKIVNTQGKTRT